MTPVFTDTVGLLALWNESDQWHEAAKAAFARLNPDETSLTTTTFVLLECGNAAARTPFRDEVDRLRHQLELAGTLVRPTEDDWQQAWTAYRLSEAAQAGIVDQVSFVVMRRLGLTLAFTNDRHFQAAGFRTLF